MNVFDDSTIDYKEPKKFEDLPIETQNDLIFWFNTEPNDDDKKKLFQLYISGQFQSWYCPECHSLLCYANVDLEGFSMVNQPDYVSYPGNDKKYTKAYLGIMCDSCRMKS